MINVDNKYHIGDFVYLITGPDQNKRIVTAIIINKFDIIYELSFSATSSRHYDYEITETVIVN